MAPDRGTPPDVEAPQPRVAKVRPASPTPMPVRSQSRSYNPASTELDLDTLSTDSTDSLREQVRRPYDGNSDPMEHIATFRAQMTLYDTSEALMCRAFPTTLRGSARTWYAHLKPASIPSFDVLAREFELNFLASARPTTASLLEMAQGSDEPLSQFVGRFTSQVQGIPDLHPSLAIQAFLTGLGPSRFFWLLIERPPMTLPEMLKRAHQYMAAETLIAGKRDETKRSRGEQSRGHLTPPPKRRVDRSKGEEHSSHDDTLVISILMANAYVKRVMIDTESSTDILYFDAFQRLGLIDLDLAPLTSTLTGFTGDFFSPLGTTTIPITFGGEPRPKTLLVSFMVVKLPSAYNVIIGCPTLSRLRAVMSTYHRILKFPTQVGVGEVRSDPRESRQCYLTAITLFKRSRTEPFGVMPPGPEESTRDTHSAERKSSRQNIQPTSTPPTRQDGRLGAPKDRGQQPDLVPRQAGPEPGSPYRVIDVIRDGTYTLAAMEGRVLPRTWHITNL
ncbi:hypothetical protein B296_00048605 [Ensete ventricosum]|uniref:Retrotransposon gag domain-containing protein n=1 Tax=Ensete ventricosum TaxID=4639 RepID=A0A426WXI6_ENSVE|nr:hypothetical protein B296_00048605 [Ensete ventricosum]